MDEDIKITIKKPTTFDEQLEKIKERGCVVGDEISAKLILQRINYYRFSAYFLPFTNNRGTYHKDTTFSKVYRTYEFDGKLRGILFPIIEQIELYLRTQLSYFHAHKYGALGYMDEKIYNNFHDHEKFLKHRQELIEKSSSQPFVSHHIENYDSNFPIWVLIELFTTNDLSIFYADLQKADQKVIAKNCFGTIPSKLISWLHCLTILRNYCAHYSRLYYTLFSAQPHTPDGFSYDLFKQVFDYILVLKFLYPTPERWRETLVTPLSVLIEEYSDCINLKHIGFPENWKEIILS